MSLNSASPGQVVSFSAEFRKQNGRAITGVSAATWTIRDHNRKKVSTGTGTQDLIDTAIWTGTATIPSSAPVPADGAKWTVHWRLPKANGDDSTFAESFNIVPAGDESVQSVSTDVLAMFGTDFVDSIVLPAGVTSVTYTVQGETGSVLLTLTPTSSASGSDLLYQATGGSTLAMPVGNSGYYVGIWKWINAAGAREAEIHNIYILNAAAMMMVNNLRKFIDKAHLKDIHPYLSYTDSDLLHYVLRGIEKCNAIATILTFWSLNALPWALTSFIEMASALEAVRAQYLAEGMSAFDLQALGVQLNVDRTQYLDNLQSQLTAEMDKLPDAKKAWAAQGSPTIGPNGAVATSRVIGSLSQSYYARNLQFNFPVGQQDTLIVGAYPGNTWWEKMGLAAAFWGGR